MKQTAFRLASVILTRLASIWEIPVDGKNYLTEIDYGN